MVTLPLEAVIPVMPLGEPFGLIGYISAVSYTHLTLPTTPYV